jgi:hypothetical protein
LTGLRLLKSASLVTFFARAKQRFSTAEWLIKYARCKRGNNPPRPSIRVSANITTTKWLKA